MTPDPVVEGLDVLEEARPRLLPRREGLAPSQLLLERGIIHLHSASTLSGPGRPFDSAGWSGRPGASADRGARSRTPAAGGVAPPPRRRPTRSTGHSRLV